MTLLTPVFVPNTVFMYRDKGRKGGNYGECGDDEINDTSHGSSQMTGMTTSNLHFLDTFI